MITGQINPYLPKGYKSEGSQEGLYTVYTSSICLECETKKYSKVTNNGNELEWDSEWPMVYFDRQKFFTLSVKPKFIRFNGAFVQWPSSDFTLARRDVWGEFRAACFDLWVAAGFRYPRDLERLAHHNLFSAVF